MPEPWTSPSGSRWEPAPDADAAAGPFAGPAVAIEETPAHAPSDPSAGGRRRPRGRVLVALVALLSLGGLGAGAVAYERTAGAGTPTTPVAGADGRSGTGGGHRPGFDDGDHHRGGSR